MPGFSDLGLGHKLEVFRQKISALEQEVTSMRKDLSKALTLLEQLIDLEESRRSDDSSANGSGD